MEVYILSHNKSWCFLSFFFNLGAPSLESIHEHHLQLLRLGNPWKIELAGFPTFLFLAYSYGLGILAFCQVKTLGKIKIWAQPGSLGFLKNGSSLHTLRDANHWNLPLPGCHRLLVITTVFWYFCFVGFGNPELNLSNGTRLQGIPSKLHTTRPNPFHDMITMIVGGELAVLASSFGWKTLQDDFPFPKFCQVLTFLTQLILGSELAGQPGMSQFFHSRGISDQAVLV